MIWSEKKDLPGGGSFSRAGKGGPPWGRGDTRTFRVGMRPCCSTSVDPLSIAERGNATNVPQARLLNAETVQKRPRGDPFDWPPHHPILTDQTRGLLHRCGNTIGGPGRGRQSCRFCSPSGQPIGRCGAPADRDPSSNPHLRAKCRSASGCAPKRAFGRSRFFCHLQRFGGFLESGLLVPPQAALRRFPLFWTAPPEMEGW